MPIPEPSTITALIEHLNDEYGLQLPTGLSADHPLSNLWKANIASKGGIPLNDAAVKKLCDYIKPSIPESAILIWARGDPTPFPAISNNLTSFMVFIATRRSPAT